MFNFKNKYVALPCLVLSGSITFGSLAIAGDENYVFIEQEAWSGGSGNILFVDQSDAYGSSVAGDKNLLTPALQSGGGNEAYVTLTGTGGLVLLEQESTGLGLGTNTATLTGGAYAAITLVQSGINNSGSVIVGPGGNTGALFQKGEGNDGEVSVEGTNSTGILLQDGNYNSHSLIVNGQDTTVQWNQVGNNVTGVSPAQVWSNAGTISITQYSP